MSQLELEWIHKKFTIIAIIICVIGVSLIWLISCASPAAMEESGRPAGHEVMPAQLTLQRSIDREAAVVCWRFRTTEGIHCLPIAQTDLNR